MTIGSAYSIEKWARRLWPCTWQGHEKEIEEYTWCPVCGRMRADVISMDLGKDYSQPRWIYKGKVVAFLVNDALHVIQENYEFATRFDIAEAGTELVEAFEMMKTLPQDNR